MIKNRISFFVELSCVLSVVTSMVASCRPKSDSEVTGFAVKSTAFSSNRLSVCWENRSVSDVELRSLRTEIEQFVKSQFSRTVVRLEGWSDCKNPDTKKNEVRVTWWDKGESPGLMVDGASQIGNGAIYGPRLKPLSQHIESTVRAAPTLALNSVAWHEALSLRGRAVALADIKMNALHEFGHSIGLLHENEREDSTCNKNAGIEMHMKYWRKADEGLAGVMKSIVGTKDFDPQSVMNYCYLDRFKATGKVVLFSDGDVQTINALYSNLR